MFQGEKKWRNPARSHLGRDGGQLLDDDAEVDVADGTHVPTPVCAPTMSVDLDRLRRILPVGVAWGYETVAALRGALVGGYRTALVTDRQTAMALNSDVDYAG